MSTIRGGAVWRPPYSLDVTALLRPGENKIRIDVANTAVNYMAGHALPDYRLLNLRYGERFQVQDLQKIRPVPSGLVGPVRLVANPNEIQSFTDGEVGLAGAARTLEKKGRSVL